MEERKMAWCPQCKEEYEDHVEKMCGLRHTVGSIVK